MVVRVRFSNVSLRGLTENQKDAFSKPHLMSELNTKSEQLQCCNEQRAFKMAVTNSRNEVVIKADRPFR